MISDVTRTGEWSPVCKACWWDDGDGPWPGAWFTGRNELPERTWETRSQVVAADRGRACRMAGHGRAVAQGRHLASDRRAPPGTARVTLAGHAQVADPVPAPSSCLRLSASLQSHSPCAPAPPPRTNKTCRTGAMAIPFTPSRRPGPVPDAGLSLFRAGSPVHSAAADSRAPKTAGQGTRSVGVPIAVSDWQAGGTGPVVVVPDAGRGGCAGQRCSCGIDGGYAGLAVFSVLEEALADSFPGRSRQMLACSGFPHGPGPAPAVIGFPPGHGPRSGRRPPGWFSGLWPGAARRPALLLPATAVTLRRRFL